MGFFACYLLTPVTPPQRLRCTYVGFTVSPTRRIRQHNGELVNGAKRTTKHRPWEMIVVVHGFPSKFHALQFEYAWQHPYNCRFTKARLVPLKGSKGLGHPRSVKRKLVELHEMLHVAPWDAFPLTVSYTTSLIQDLVRTSPFYQWPAHMTCEVRPLQEFAHCQAPASAAAEGGSLATAGDRGEKQCTPLEGSTCCICDDAFSVSGPQALRCYHADCHAQYHALCLADHFLLEVSMSAENNDIDGREAQPALRPERGSCPECTEELLWPLLVRGSTSRREKASSLAKKTKRSVSKKRRRLQGKGTDGEAPSDSFGRQGSRTSAKGDGVIPAKSTAQESGSTFSPGELDTVDSDGYVDAGWFDDDVSTVEYFDGEYGAEQNEYSVSYRSSSQHRYEEQKPPTIVDLTSLDD